MAVKCERYSKGHESHYLQPLYCLEYRTVFAVSLALNSHLSPTLLPGELRTKRLINEHVANKRGVAGPPKNGDRK